MLDPIKYIRQRLRLRSKRRKLKRFHMGFCTYFGVRVSIASKETRIGKFCSIANDVKIGTTQHPTSWLSTSPFQYYDGKELLTQLPDFQRRHFDGEVKPCVIGNDV